MMLMNGDGRLTSVSFSLKDTRTHIDNLNLPDLNFPTRWSRYVPRKVLIFVWWALLNRGGI